MHDPIDPDLHLSRQDYKDLHNPAQIAVPPGAVVSANALEPPIPDLAEILAAPKPPKIAAAQLVSVAVTDDVPLKDVLIELSRLADIDVEVDAGITGGISFRAKDRPFNEVIERIAALAGLRYKVQNNVLRIERDTPYIHTYALDMLNIERASQGNINVNSTGAGSGGGGSSEGGTSTGSSSTITAQSQSDFWGQFTAGIDSILKYQSPTMVSAASVAVQPAAPLPDGTPAPAAPVPVSPTGNTSTAGAFFTLNRQAGTLTVSGTERQHDMVKRFLRAIESNISSQVLIEAKIVEVSLNDNYQTGINWSKLGGNSLSLAGDLDSVLSANPAISGATVTFLKNDILGTNIDLSGAVKLLDEFGTARALSSPRLNAMNNQQAVLSFVENVLYFNVECEITDAVPATANSAAIPAKVEVTTEDQSAPVGIVISLQPSINKETSEITLSVRPTLTRVTEFVSDPGFELCKAQAASTLPSDSPILTTLQNLESKYPQLETREIDSILKVGSGQIMVIGGLLEDKVTNTDAGVPGLGKVPYVGNLFKSVEKVNTKKELVILMRATIVDPRGYVDHADKALYQKFIQDPRPLQFPTE